MFFPFFSRSDSKKSPDADPISSNDVFEPITSAAEGSFFADFKLYHRDSSTPIDLLLFFPNKGLFIGEKIGWKPDELKGASVERASRVSKKTPFTRFESLEYKLAQKLQDVLSFDSTPCYRFIWLEYLSEEEFDTLDPTFHELLPKSRVVFRNESAESIARKFDEMAEDRSEPLSKLKVIGSLNAHLLRLPSAKEPFGAFLSDEQHAFFSIDATHSIITLLGEHGSGKSTALIRKAVLQLLDGSANGSILIITPTQLAGELLRNELISLLEYAAIDIDLSRIHFFTPTDTRSVESCKSLQEVSALFCDDAHLLESGVLGMIRELRGNRTMVLTTITPGTDGGNTFLLPTSYRPIPEPRMIESEAESLNALLISEICSKLSSALPSEIMIIFPDEEKLSAFQTVLKSELEIEARGLTRNFSLQYEDLDSILLAVAEMTGGLSCSHLFLICSEPAGDYNRLLSRASESATIITLSNPEEETDEENHQE